MKTRKRGVLIILWCIAIGQTVQLMVGAVADRVGCITALHGEEEHWAVTQCPPPPDTCEDMAVVSPDHPCDIVNSTYSV